MQPTKLSACAGVLLAFTLLAFPLLSACVALSRWQMASTAGLRARTEGQRTGLRLLVLQTFIPPLQMLPLLRSVTTLPSRLSSECVIFLPVASLLLGSASFYFLLRYSRVWARIFLPLLNLLVFTYSAALFLAAGATA